MNNVEKLFLVLLMSVCGFLAYGMIKVSIGLNNLVKVLSLWG